MDGARVFGPSLPAPPKAQSEAGRSHAFRVLVGWMCSHAFVSGLMCLAAAAQGPRASAEGVPPRALHVAALHRHGGRGGVQPLHRGGPAAQVSPSIEWIHRQFPWDLCIDVDVVSMGSRWGRPGIDTVRGVCWPIAVPYLFSVLLPRGFEKRVAEEKKLDGARRLLLKTNTKGLSKEDVASMSFTELRDQLLHVAPTDSKHVRRHRGSAE